MKIGQIYDLESYKKFLDSGKKPGFTDSYAGVVLERNLVHVSPTVLEKKYPELGFMSSGINADNTGGFARKIQTLRTLEQGSFKESGDSSSNKGKISLTAEDSDLLVKSKEANSSWTDDEVKEAELQNINLVSKFMVSHNKIYQRELDEIGYLGHTAALGLLNHGSFDSDAAAGLASTLTSQQFYDAISGLIQDQWNAVNNTVEYKANRVDMPTSVFNLAAKKMLDTTAGPATILTALKGNYPEIEFRSTFRAETDLNGGGAGADSATVAYNNGPDAMVFRLPVPLTIGEIIKTGSFSHSVDSKYRCAGLDLLESTAGRLLTGL